jgi:hypothetical protein
MKDGHSGTRTQRKDKGARARGNTIPSNESARSIARSMRGLLGGCVRTYGARRSEEVKADHGGRPFVKSEELPTFCKEYGVDMDTPPESNQSSRAVLIDKPLVLGQVRKCPFKLNPTFLAKAPLKIRLRANCTCKGSNVIYNIAYSSVRCQIRCLP